ncbi:MAG TPA: hypothetical protein VFL51_17425 [Pseudolabrys sp.]|nr:hypothetical protein [Pseudolabrys sp.]
MPTWKERYDQAGRHVALGQKIIERQRMLINNLKICHASTSAADEILLRFERSQAIFEDDLRRISREDR